jgi:type I restriction-modification system DNA methylase subunit
MLIKGQDVANIAIGNTLSEDGHAHKKFDYMLSNPPFGVEWKKVEKEIRKEHEQLGFNGRFGAGLPRVSDGSMLFLLHLISKMRPASEGGSRFGIVLNGSPLFTGGAGSGESEIRRYVLENDLVEATQEGTIRAIGPVISGRRDPNMTITLGTLRLRLLDLKRHRNEMGDFLSLFHARTPK